MSLAEKIIDGTNVVIALMSNSVKQLTPELSIEVIEINRDNRLIGFAYGFLETCISIGAIPRNEVDSWVCSAVLRFFEHCPSEKWFVFGNDNWIGTAPLRRIAERIVSLDFDSKQYREYFILYTLLLQEIGKALKPMTAKLNKYIADVLDDIHVQNIEIQRDVILENVIDCQIICPVSKVMVSRRGQDDMIAISVEPRWIMLGVFALLLSIVRELAIYVYMLYYGHLAIQRLREPGQRIVKITKGSVVRITPIMDCCVASGPDRRTCLSESTLANMAATLAELR